MAFGKTNHVKIDPTAYSLMLLGEPKIGKSTVMKEALELLTDTSYMFAEMGRERGADAIEGIRCINCPSWSEDYNEENNSVGWIDLVDDICDNPTDYNIKVLVVDTYDQYITIAEDEALRLWNKDNPEKRAKSLNASWGGFGAGGKKAIELMFEAVDRLNEVGVKVWWIGHVRNKSITDIASGESYEVLSSDQQQNYFNALKKNLHFLGLAYIDRQIVREKTGRKDIKGKDIMKNAISEESRKIKFRDDSYAIDCGTRFSEIRDTIDMDAHQLVQTLEDAIKAEQSKSGKSFEESKEEQEAAEAKQMKEIAKAEKAKKAKKEVDLVVSKITDYIKANKSSMAKIKPLLEKSKELGYKNPTEIDKLEDAEAVLALTEE